MYLGLLFHHRKQINPTLADDAREDDIKYIGFLFEGYEPRCLYFEVIECVRKLMLTGMMIFFFPDTPSQACARVCVDCGLI